MENTKILKNLGQYKKEAILGPLFKLLEASFELFVPIVVGDIIDIGIKNNDMKYIVSRFLLLLLLGVVGLVCSVTAQYFSAKASVGFSTKTRQDLFEKIQSLDYYGIDKEGTSSLVNRLTGDINQVQNGVNLVLRLFLRSPFVVFGAMVMAFSINVEMAYLFVLAIIILSIIVFGIMLISIPLYKKVQSKSDKVMVATRENLIGVRVVRAFNQQENQIKNYDILNRDLVKSQKIVGNISQAINPLTFVCINAFIIWLIYRGAIQVNMGNLSQGNVVSLYNYMTQILVELIKLANLIIQITKALASKNRIEKILNLKNELIENEKQTTFDENAPILAFENVSMKYPTNKGNSITNINFSVNKGETLGIIGGTGSGKTTLVNLIPHFYDATEGKVLYKGVNVQNIDSEYLREKVSIATQKVTVFSGTIKENMLMGNKNATEEDIIKSLKISQSYDFVFAKDDNINYVVEQDGRNLSGGQRQRLSIARALMKNSDILVLDDTTSALDYKTDMLLRSAINTNYKDLTKILVSQRTSSIRSADKIIVLDDGKIVGVGTHKELLKNCDVYREIHLSQYKEGDDEE